VPPGQIIPKARNAASHPTSHKQHGDTRLATAPDRPTRRVSQSPESVRVARGPTGKPELEGSNLAVSLAHSGAAVLVAIASAGDVGVDVEALGRDITDWQLVEQALKKGERWAVRANGRSSRCRYPTIRQPLLSKGGSQGCVSTRRGARTLRPRRIGSSRLATLIVL
jgi:hypothetical protein